MTSKRNQPENKFVVLPIIRKLRWLLATDNIIWFQRLVAEDDVNCPAGTPDIEVIVNCRNGKIAVLFIECKKPVKREPRFNDLRFEQKEFFKKMEDKSMTLCVVINNPDQLYSAIEKARNL